MQPVILLMDLLCLVLGSQERYGEWRASKGGRDNCYKALSPFCVQSFFGMPDSTNASLLQTPRIPTASWWDIWVKVVGCLVVGECLYCPLYLSSEWVTCSLPSLDWNASHLRAISAKDGLLSETLYPMHMLRSTWKNSSWHFGIG